MASHRYLHNNEHLLQPADSHEELLASLTRINLYNPPVQTCSTGWTFDGFYAGPTSIAYLFFRLHTIYPELMFKGQSLLDWSQAYLDVGAHCTNLKVDPSHCGIANEALARLTLQAVVEKEASLAQKLCSYSSMINTMKKQGSDEWLYGRAGYIYFLRLARSSFDTGQDHWIRSLIDNTIKKVVERIVASPLPWEWHGKAYLGAAHGSIGILTQIVLSTGADTRVEEVLSQLLEEQFSNGNFPSSLSSRSDELVQFCHGSPGFVLSLTSLKPHFPSLQSKIHAAVTTAQEDVWKRGLLTKTPCLCHGIAGNALALDGPRFHNFLTYITTEVLERNGGLDRAGRSDDFAGLFTGEAGRAWVWAIANKNLERTCIGFNDL
jgi:Lanthionine synthetase C-like protein